MGDAEIRGRVGGVEGAWVRRVWRMWQRINVPVRPTPAEQCTRMGGDGVDWVRGDCWGKVRVVLTRLIRARMSFGGDVPWSGQVV